MTCLDSLHESLLYLLHDSYRLWLIVVIISNRFLYIRGLSLVDFSPVWPHFYTVPLAQIHLCSLPYIHSQGLKNNLVLFVYWISLPSTECECKLENAITPSSLDKFEGCQWVQMALLLSWVSNSQYSDYSDSNTSWTPGEPSEVPLGMSMTTSAIKIDAVTFLFLAFGQTPPWPLVQDPCSATPLSPLSQKVISPDSQQVWISPTVRGYILYLPLGKLSL